MRNAEPAIVNDLKKLTLDGQPAHLKNPPQNPRLPPFGKGGLGGFLEEMPNMQYQLSFDVHYSSCRGLTRDKASPMFLANAKIAGARKERPVD